MMPLAMTPDELQHEWTMTRTRLKEAQLQVELMTAHLK